MRSIQRSKEESDLPFIGFTYVKENNLICQVDGLPSTVEFQQRHLKIAHLEEKIVLEKENRTKVHEIFQFVYVATDLYLISFRNWNLN